MSEHADIPKPKLKAKHAKQLLKTEMCKFFLVNRCGKGRLCGFAHSLSELREKPDLNRTSMCRTFLQTGNCEDPLCKFAHSERDLRTTTSFFKTKLCRFASNGRCKHGSACRFAHHETELNADGIFDPSSAGSQDQETQDSLGDMPDDTSRDPSDTSGDPSDLSMRADDYHIVASDQSTRAGTIASTSKAPTPEGSADSGQEESSQNGGTPQGSGEAGDVARRDRQSGDRMDRPGRHCRTVIVANLPQFLTQQSILSLLEEQTQNLRGSFDFFYCPWDPDQGKNLGYAIVNFFNRAEAAEFKERWANQHIVPPTRCKKALRVIPATLQGRAANIRHFSGFPLAQHPDPRHRPLVRGGPNEELRPMAVVQELVCNGGLESQFMPLLPGQRPPRSSQASSAQGGWGVQPASQQQRRQQKPQQQQHQQHTSADTQRQVGGMRLESQNDIFLQQTQLSQNDMFLQQTQIGSPYSFENASTMPGLFNMLGMPQGLPGFASMPGVPQPLWAPELADPDFRPEVYGQGHLGGFQNGECQTQGR